MKQDTIKLNFSDNFPYISWPLNKENERKNSEKLPNENINQMLKEQQKKKKEKHFSKV